MNRRRFFGSLVALFVAPKAVPPTHAFTWHEAGWHSDGYSWTWYSKPQTLYPYNPSHHYVLQADGVYVSEHGDIRKISHDV